MKVSYNWLQSYFKEKLPSPEKAGEVLTHLSFELEGMESPLTKGVPHSDAGRVVTTPASEDGGTPFSKGDTVLDVKVLPDRACYTLSHRGIAYELAAGLELEMSAPQWQKTLPSSGAVLPDVRVETTDLCTYFAGRRVTNLRNGASPKWMQELLASLGQRSINAIVDVTNFVMFDIGRPLHAFDAKKVQGPIVVRFATEGETMRTLDGKDVKLNPSVLVLADDEGPLALAGIKGGTRASVDENTTDIILEAANWDATYIRKASQKLGIRTDASKRFENRVPPAYATEGVEFACSLIVECAGTPETKTSETLALGSASDASRTLTVSAKTTAQKTGINLSAADVTSALRRLAIASVARGDELTLAIPHFRLDLSIPEDIVEEVGRVVGYDKIPTVLPPKTGDVELPASFYYEWKIRQVLIAAGFSEIFTSSFNEKGDVIIEKPLAEDKKFARPNLRSNFERALKMNAVNAPLLGADETRIFELGKVFPKGGEHSSLAIGVAGSKKKIAGVLEGALELLSQPSPRGLGTPFSKGDIKDGVFEANLDAVFASLPEPTEWDISLPPQRSEKFTPFSPYPFIVRDVALFVSPLAKGVSDSDRTGVVFPSAESVAQLIREHAGSLVVRGPELFDEFSREGKKSLAFRLVFQSFDRTLSDGEVNSAMENVYSALKAEGWQVR